MKLAVLRDALLGLCLLAAAVCVGCNRHAAAGRSAAALKSGKPSPEESFRVIIDTFRRKVEDTQIGFVVADGGTRSTMVGTNKVSYELVPPAKAEDHYKAVITVDSQSRYSLRRSKSSSEESEREQNASNQGTNPLADPNEKKGIGILEPDLASKPVSESSQGSSKSTQSTEESIARRPDELVRKYELVYDNGRWALVTKLNPDTEKSIQFAFEQALGTQIWQPIRR